MLNYECVIFFVPCCLQYCNVFLYDYLKVQPFHFVFLQKEEDAFVAKAVKLTSRERRFIKFSSVQYDGQLYMTPQDFLESVVEQEPRRE